MTTNMNSELTCKKPIQGQVQILRKMVCVKCSLEFSSTSKYVGKATVCKYCRFGWCKKHNSKEGCTLCELSSAWADEWHNLEKEIWRTVLTNI